MDKRKLFWLYVVLCFVTAISAITIGVWQGTLKETEEIILFETIEVIDEVRVPYSVIVVEEKLTWVEYPVYPELPELRHFENTRELEEWLDSFPHPVIWMKDYDCEDYALDLQQQAYEDGYWVSIQYDWRKWHALNSCWVGLEGIYFIEPQTHEFWFEGRRD